MVLVYLQESKWKTKKTDTVLKETVKNLDSFQFRLHREYDKKKQT